MEDSNKTQPSIERSMKTFVIENGKLKQPL